MIPGRPLIRSWPGRIAAGYIVLMILVAIFGYFIIPDATRNANSQHVEIALKKPGFSCIFLRVPVIQDSTAGFFKKLLNGEPAHYREYPIHGYYFKGDSLVAEFYTGLTPNDGPTGSFAIAELLTDDVHFSSNQQARSHIASNHIIHRTFLLGTDRFGRDYFSRLILGARISISVGFVAVIIALLIGVTLGAVAGYAGGLIDRFFVWLFSVVWSLPTILLVIAITFALGKGFWQIFIAIGATFWVDIARVVRGQVLSIKEREYVEAARALGIKSHRIVFRHILPGVRGPVIVLAASSFSSAILVEAGLGFLGLGVQPPVPTWGGMVKEYYSHLVLDTAYLALLPGLAIVLAVMAFMILGNELRDNLDVKNA